jgi:dTDP-glucose pyrophosphorylase
MMTNQPEQYYGVILAAGLGSRINPLSFALPKPLLPVCNKPIIQYQIEYLRQLGIRQIRIVVHHLKEKLMDYFGDGSSLGVHIRYIEQKHPLGIAHAVALLEPHIDAPFLLFLGDIFLVPRQLETLLKFHFETGGAGFLAVKREKNPEYIKRNYAVIVDDGGLVKRVIEKPRYVTNDLKGCGIYFFDLPIFDSVRRTPRTAMRDEYEITSAIQILIDDGYKVYAAEVVEWDMNVTVPYDLLLCNLRQLEASGMKNIMGERVHINPEATISNSVVGNDVTIDSGVKIDKCVIFPNSVVARNEPIRNAIVTPEGIYCENETAGVAG